MAECWLLQQKSKPNALVRTVSKPLRLSRMVVESKPGVAVSDDKFSVVVPEKKPQEVEPDSTYLPFVSEGLVSLTEDDATVPIQILRNTGATQSLLLQDVLPLTEQSSTGTSVLVQRVELGVLKVPLHKVYLRSNLVSGTVTVGVRPTLPMQGIAFVLGNDLAGGKVNVNPELQIMDEPETVEAESKDIYPACVVTRSAARRARDWILKKWLKLNSGMHLEINISSIQAINIYSNEVKYRHVQFGNPTRPLKSYNSKCTFMVFHRKCMAKTFSDDKLTVNIRLK